MDRLNSEGILIDDLPAALQSRRVVMTARRIDSCLLCRRKGVNEAGICTYCYSSLDGEAANLASKWLSGIGP